MAGDEVLVLLLSAAVAIGYWGRWYIRLLRLDTLIFLRLARLCLFLVHLLCLGLVLIVLTTWAAAEVRGSAAYIELFVAIWAVALSAVNVLSHVIGVNALHDGVERRNSAALWASGGAWLATTLCVCGANIGEGPTIYTTLAPMGLAVGALGGLWLLFAVLTKNTASIAVDRDRASGIRLAGLLFAWGLILGRAVLGDWVSTEATLHDFAVLGWPALLLLAIAVAVEPMLEPSRGRPFPSVVRAGVRPAASYVAAATAWLVWLR